MHSKFFLFFFGLSAMLLVQTGYANIPRFDSVSPGVYRGGRPDQDGLFKLSQLGVKTDLDLENDDDAILKERDLADVLHIHFVSKQMSGFFTPDDREVDEILDILADSSNWPIFVHCQHGEDRTGLIVGLYRVFKEHRDAETAYHEMLQHGFHRSLFLLNRYYEKRTGWDD